MERTHASKQNWRWSNANIKPVNDNQDLHDALDDFRNCMKLEMDKIRIQIKKVNERELEMSKLREFSIQSLEQLRKDIHQTIDNNANLLKKKGRNGGNHVDNGDTFDKSLSGLKSKADENLVYLLEDRIEALEKTLKEKDDVIELLKEKRDNTKIRFRVT